MQTTSIRFVIVATSFFLLTGCGKILNDFLDGQFPLNTKNDGNKITVYAGIATETKVIVRGTYTSNKCERSHFNAAYTKVSYSPIKKEVVIESADDIDNKKSTSVLPINGGGWCNWQLTNIELSVIPKFNENSVTTPIFIPVIATNRKKIKYKLTIAPIKNINTDKLPVINYSISKVESRNISNKKNGEIYFNYEIDYDLETIIYHNNEIVFPNGFIEKSPRSKHVDFVMFDKIIKNSHKKEYTSFSEYLD
ncbi:hypothetical protein [Providencia sp. PROV254]|uniref:hypothetical protein n=1 Tax=Providencia sp. PROV254 TaxID=2949942 RepID=UPI002349FE28|nr:hypothetical protein [Providencia sp. PROV254]